MHSYLQCTLLARPLQVVLYVDGERLGWPLELDLEVKGVDLRVRGGMVG